jgi:hypothetical protein
LSLALEHFRHEDVNPVCSYGPTTELLPPKAQLEKNPYGGPNGQ